MSADIAMKIIYIKENTNYGQGYNTPVWPKNIIPFEYNLINNVRS
jgi:hypothetical protein